MTSPNTDIVYYYYITHADTDILCIVSPCVHGEFVH